MTTHSKKEAILRERARLLAQPIAQEKDFSRAIELIKFRVNEELYALETMFVLEVYPLKELTPLPFTPSFVLGLINVRRKITSVIDLQVLFKGSGKTDGPHVLLLQGEGIEFGILASEIMGLFSVFPEELKPPVLTLSEMQQDLLKGLTTEGVVVLNGKKLLGISFHG